MKEVLLLLILSAQSILSINEYCNICKNHTLCIFTKEGPSEKCVDYRNISLSSENKTDIVDAHNVLRNLVASGEYISQTDMKYPEASRMNMLKWNEELSEIAQRWADQCPSQGSSDTCRNIQDFKVGQNIYSIKIQSNNIPKYSEILKMQWSNEAKQFTSENMSKLITVLNTKFKSFPQTIWDTVQYIGCGVSFFRSNEQNEGNITHSTLLIVCNFAPAEYVPNAPIYQLGIPCSDCPNRLCNVKYNNLCETEKSNSLIVSEKQVEKLFENVMSPWDWKNKLKITREYPRKIRGIWYNGECRCNFIYRSDGRSCNTFNKFSLFAFLLFPQL